MTLAFDKELDARGLRCPLPILRCKKGIAELTAGQVLKIVATDKGAVQDFENFCKQTGHTLLSFAENNTAEPTEFVFFIQKRVNP